MDGIHPKFVLSKRFPVHAAIELLDLHTLAKLLNEEARFHFGRKLTDSEVNMMAVMSYFIVVLVLGVSINIIEINIIMLKIIIEQWYEFQIFNLASWHLLVLNDSSALCFDALTCIASQRYFAMAMM